MSEELDLSGLDDLSKKRIKQEVKDSVEGTKLKERWKMELENNPDVQEYLKKYRSSTISFFIDSYVQNKYLAYKYRKHYADQVERDRSIWIEEATKHLALILQKKLFDMQCLWRANQLEISEIDIALDFSIWEIKIFECPFLEINTLDLELYSEFLLSGKTHYLEPIEGDWQDYEFYKDSDDGSERELPAWYQYHNFKTGNGSLLQLHDCKGEKEKFYIGLSEGHKTENKATSEYLQDERPFLFDFAEEATEDIVNQFEDAEAKKYIQNYLRYNKSSDMDIDELWYNLSNVEECIPIESHYDYKQALEKAYNNYFFGKVAEHLSIAYSQYLFNRKMNISTADILGRDVYDNLRKKLCSSILKGRELNGEPRDFNY